eukprot:TRINITY_DN86408_c0_g1_i1.p1 TRINITY_DN86408_c0_g1~~TRINITY_DN86408_c0_g1_i1.p1  ORF type:complete len:113 (+),score=12.83 TRINITY_DN86408_c0_g1_i1:74-412(+)
MYVDASLPRANDPDSILQLQKFLHELFHMKYLGPSIYFPVLKVHRIQEGLFINQHKYTMDLIVEARLQETTPAETPLELNLKCQKHDGTPLSEPRIKIELVAGVAAGSQNVM